MPVNARTGFGMLRKATIKALLNITVVNLLALTIIGMFL